MSSLTRTSLSREPDLYSVGALALIRENRYKIGDSFVSLALPEVQTLLSTSTEQIDEEVTKLEDSLGGVQEEMKQLKVALYARFGKSINLET